MVESLLRGQQNNKNPLFPTPFMPIYQRLLASGVGEELARNLIEKIQNSIDKEKITQEPYVRNYIAGTLVKLVPVSGPLRLQEGKAAVAAFVGATGVGKTTTIAKLAAHYALGEKKRVALVTIDTYRIAAIEQLRTFANIIGLPIDVVLTESELDTILAKYEKMDLVLIDTAGRSQRDQLQMAELASCFGNRKRADVHLVLSATSSPQNLTETLERFSHLGLDSLIFTKLDESNIFGSILSATLLSQLPLSYLTTGQQVPEDIEVATPERIVDLILNVSQWRELEIA
jgi:flagellar biosynthesis protein FlhF